MEWYQSIENLRQLAQYIQDRDGGYDSLDAAEFLEKPWKWDEDWNEYQRPCKYNNGDDAPAYICKKCLSLKNTEDTICDCDCHLKKEPQS